MHTSAPKITAIVPIAAGLLLHLSTALFQSADSTDSFVLGLFGFASLPYLICVLLLTKFGRDFEAFSGAALPLVFDLAVYYSVFVNPSHTHAALNLLAAPFVSLFVLLPAGLFVGWGVSKIVVRYRANAS